MPHRRPAPVFSLSLFLSGLLEDWRESDEPNNSLEDTLRERDRDRVRGEGEGEKSLQQQYPQNFRPAILYLYSLGGGSNRESGDELSVCAPLYAIRVLRGAREGERMHGYKGRVIF